MVYGIILKIAEKWKNLKTELQIGFNGGHAKDKAVDLKDYM